MNVLGKKLLAASESGDIKMVRLLVSHGIKVDDHGDYDGHSALHEAAVCGSAEVAEHLIRHGADLESRDHTGWTPLHHAAYIGSLAVARTLVAMGSKVNAVEDSGLTPLHLAVSCNRCDMAHFLVENGADIYAADQFGITPLHKAVHYGHPALVRYLLELGADPVATTTRGMTTLDKLIRVTKKTSGHALCAIQLFEANGLALNDQYEGLSLLDIFANSPDGTRTIRSEIAGQALIDGFEELANDPVPPSQPAAKKVSLTL